MNDDKHYIVIENEDGDYEIVHPDSCPKEIWTGDLASGVEFYTCTVGYIIQNTGIEDLVASEEHEKLKKPGEYEIAAYVYNSPSMFEDNELYLYFVE